MTDRKGGHCIVCGALGVHGNHPHNSPQIGNTNSAVNSVPAFYPIPKEEAPNSQEPKVTEFGTFEEEAPKASDKWEPTIREWISGFAIITGVITWAVLIELVITYFIQPSK